MNSDESQTNEPEQEQEPAVEMFDEQQLEQEPTAETSDYLEEQSSTDEFAVEQAEVLAAVDELNNVEEQSPKVEPVEPFEDNRAVADLAQTVAELERQERELRQKIALLQETQSKILSDQLAQTQAAVTKMVQEGLTELEQRKQALQISVEQLERRRERIRAEMRTSFAGVSQELAIRVQGFKDYLVGSLQDLASAAEQLDLAPVKELSQPEVEESRPIEKAPTPKFAEQGFQEQARQIRKILDQYRTLPDYYGPPWQLRRTFEPVHAERVSNWLFTQGGRGAIKTMGSRLQNILITSTIISVLRSVYGGRVRTLVLANSPERLGEWRRGLQDCLGITRSDFGPERGIIMFESAEALAQKADRLVKDCKFPLIVIDETEDLISLSILQFPLWLAFAADPQTLMAAKDF